MTATQPDIHSPYALTGDHIRQFREDGFIKLKDVLSADALDYYGRRITALVKSLNRETRPVEERSTYAKAFLQITNLWPQDALVKEFVLSRRLGRIATQLLGTEGVRMYHDQALYKEPSGGHTPWHVDQFYWPLSSNNTVTAWIPLHAVPSDMGPLEFSKGSQRIMFGRDLAISDESEQKIEENLKMSDLPKVAEPFDLGEVSFHYGYTFHRAGPNTTAKPREVMTIIYMDRDMRLAEPANKAQVNDWNAWCPGAKVGEIIDTHLNPILYEKAMDT